MAVFTTMYTDGTSSTKGQQEPRRADVAAAMARQPQTPPKLAAARLEACRGCSSTTCGARRFCTRRLARMVKRIDAACPEDRWPLPVMEATT